MKILVCGGAGYIGSHVTRELLDNNYSVTVFDNLSSGSSKNLFSDASFIKGDILDFNHLNSVIKTGYDAIFHFAALKAAGESMFKPQLYSQHNITGTLNIINAATTHKIRYFIFSSSAAVYGEPKYLPIDENHPTDPLNYYGFTKLEIERILSWYDRLCDLKYAALRYFNAAGYDINGKIQGLEDKPQNLIPCVMEVASGIRDKLFIFGNDYPTPDGTCIRDYIHVSDLASAHVKALHYITEKNTSVMLNLGSETGISVKTIVDTAETVTGKAIPYKIVSRRDGDCTSLYASSAKAKKVLGWNLRYSDTDTLLRSTWNIYSLQ